MQPISRKPNWLLTSFPMITLYLLVVARYISSNGLKTDSNLGTIRIDQ